MPHAGRRSRLHRGFLEPARRIQARLSHLDVPLDDRQKVIEVVCDAARQHSERLQLARAQQLFFHLFALRNLSPQLLGGLVQFGRALLDSEFQCLIQGFGLLFAACKSSTRSRFSNCSLSDESTVR